MTFCWDCCRESRNEDLCGAVDGGSHARNEPRDKSVGAQLWQQKALQGEGYCCAGGAGAARVLNLRLCQCHNLQHLRALLSLSISEAGVESGI